MNVDEAMETAKAYLVAREQMQEPLFESEEVAVTLAREVERLRVWKTRWKDAAQKLRRQLEESGDGDTWRRACRRVELELEKTHTEVERLRAEVQRLDMAGTHSCHDDCQRLPCAQRREIERLRAELAAAKAASVVPVEKYEIGINYKNEVTIYMHSRNDAESAFKWLQGCMKDTPPTT